MNLCELFGGSSILEFKVLVFYEIVLDVIILGVMVVDKNWNIIYVNFVVYNLLKYYEEEICIVLFYFLVDNLVGQNIDQFYKNFGYQCRIFVEFIVLMELLIVVGDVNFDLKFIFLLDV